MTAGMRRAKSPVSRTLAGPYGHPYHPMLVTIPIGAWVLSLFFDISSHLVARPAFLAKGSEWLIAAGLIGALAAGAAGLLDLLAIPAGTVAFRTACTHMIINVTLIFSYVADFAWRLHATGSSVAAGPLLLSVICVIGLTVSGYLGGKLTYSYGVRVAAETDQADGYLTAVQASALPPAAAQARMAIPQTTRSARRRRT